MATASVEQLARRTLTAKTTLETTLELAKQSHASEIARLQASQSETMSMFRRAVDDRGQSESRLVSDLATLRADHAALAAKLSATVGEHETARAALAARLADAEAAHRAALEYDQRVCRCIAGACAKRDGT